MTAFTVLFAFVEKKFCHSHLHQRLNYVLSLVSVFIMMDGEDFMIVLHNIFLDGNGVTKWIIGKIWMLLRDRTAALNSSDHT